MYVKFVLFLLPPPVKRLLKRYLPSPLKRLLYLHFFQRKETIHISSKQSRRWLHDHAIQKLLDATTHGDILFVGVASYTWELIESLERLEGRRIVTLDISPDCKIWGAENHLVGSILVCDELIRRQKFSVIVINGVFGWGVDTVSDMTKSIRAILNVIQSPDSIILIGWRTGTIEDPLNIHEITDLLKPVDIGDMKSRTCFGDGQVYDIFMPR